MLPLRPSRIGEATATAHIALDIRVTQGGYPGIGRATEGLAIALLDANTKHRLALLHRADRPLPERVVAALRKPHHLLAIGAAPRSVQDQVELPLRLRQYRLDLYHAPYYAIALKPGRPYVVTLHDTIPKLYPRYWPRGVGAVIRAWQEQAVTGASFVITGSLSARLDIERLYGIKRERVAVTPWGPVAWDDAAKAPDVTIPDPYLLCVCTNKPHKNLTRLIEAYCAAAHDSSQFPALVIAGGWSDRYPEPTVAAKACSAPGRIQFLHGPTDAELRHLYQHAHGFVYPSLYEGFGLPLLEAMQAGLPIAASTTPAVAEVTGDAALSFDPLNKDSIVAAIRALTCDRELRARLREAAGTRLATFDWRVTARETLRAYDGALGVHGSAARPQYET